MIGWVGIGVYHSWIQGRDIPINERCFERELVHNEFGIIIQVLRVLLQN
jgi:hypothetical protein